MSQTFTDDDVEKRVENAAGDVIGVVTAVEGDAVRVEPRPGVMDSIRSALGWGRARDDAVYVHADSVDEISGGTIRIETDPLADETNAEPSPDAEPETGEVATRDAEREPGLGPAPDEGLGRGNREPRNAAEPGKAAPDEGVRPSEGPSERATETDAAFDESDGGSRGAAHGSNTDANTTGMDAAEESTRGDDRDETPVGPIDESGTREESGSIPVADEAIDPEEMDLLESQRHGVDDSVDDAEEIAEMDAVDESEIEPESAGENGSEPAAQREFESEPAASASTDVAPGIDADSLAEASETEGTRSDRTPSDGERDTADELDVGTDPDTLEAVAETDAEADRGNESGVGGDSEGTDLAEKLDRGGDLESVVESGTHGERPDEGSEPTTRRTGPDVTVGPTSEVDEKPVPDERSTAGAGSSTDAAADARRAIGEGGRTVTRGLRMQREMAHVTIEMQAELGRRSIEQFRSVTHAYVDTLASMTGVGADSEGRRSTDRTDEPGSEDGG